jgi:hypothetical protein
MVVNMVISLWVPKKVGNVLTCYQLLKEDFVP